MFDTDLYPQVLGLTAPWKVTDVRLDVELTEIHVHVEHPEGCRWNCPHCSRELACYDHATERQWRHLNDCQFHTLVHARVPRVECPEHGVVQVKVPWAEPHGRFTLLMERFVIDVLQACQTVKGACTLVGITWDQAWHVLERAVARGLARKQDTAIARIGVDEKAFRIGHRYLTIVNDVDRGTVEFVAEGREKASLTAFYESRTPEQLPIRRAEFRFLRRSDLKTARAWAIKENLRHLWSFRVERWARRFFSQWSGWAMRSRLEPIKNVARMMNRRLDSIITHCRHQLTNAVAEGLKSKIMAIKRRAGGYRNVGNFKDVIYFYCGGLRLYP